MLKLTDSADKDHIRVFDQNDTAVIGPDKGATYEIPHSDWGSAQKYHVEALKSAVTPHIELAINEAGGTVVHSDTLRLQTFDLKCKGGMVVGSLISRKAKHIKGNEYIVGLPKVDSEHPLMTVLNVDKATEVKAQGGKPILNGEKCIWLPESIDYKELQSFLTHLIDQSQDEYSMKQIREELRKEFDINNDDRYHWLLTPRIEDGGTETINFKKAGESIKLFVIERNLDAEHSTEQTEATPGTPVRLNNDHDCNAFYTEAYSPGDHRPCEPIWDRNKTRKSPPDDDFMKVTVKASGPLDKVKLRALSGGDHIRLWTSKKKGEDAQIQLPKTYRASSLPREIYVEGVSLGRTELILCPASLDCEATSEKLGIDVVSLHESQAGERRVINTYNKEIQFNVCSDNQLNNEYTCKWDLNGDGDRNNGSWEKEQGPKATVKYNNQASGKNNNVKLDNSNPANRRKTYDISVKLTGGLVLKKTIRVALDQFQGTPLKKGKESSAQARNDEVSNRFNWSNKKPVNFDDTKAGPNDWSQSDIQEQVVPGGVYELRVINEGNRIQYSPAPGIGMGLTVTRNCGGQRRIYLALLGSNIWEGTTMVPGPLFCEHMVSIAYHEKQHCKQLAQIRDDHWAPVRSPQSVWGLLEEKKYYLPGDFDYKDFAEAQAYLTIIGNEAFGNGEKGVGWYFLNEKITSVNENGNVRLVSYLEKFSHYYREARKKWRRKLKGNGQVGKKAKELLQQMYRNLPFKEMKRQAYKPSLRPPEP